MALPKPHPGLVIAYDYLWHDPARAAGVGAELAVANAAEVAPGNGAGDGPGNAPRDARGSAAQPAWPAALAAPAAWPAAVVLAVANQGGERIVTAVPIATEPPADPRDGLALPRATRERLGLDDRCGFVIVSELNRFVWPGADLRPVATRSASAFVYGVLPPRLFKRITAQLIGRWHARDPG